LQEDATNYTAKPGTTFEITMPSWRIGEALLHASALAKLLGDAQAEVVLVAEWTGLKGRELAAHPSSNRLMFDGHTTQEERYRGTMTARADEIPTILPELVHQMLAPLYELFDFFQLPAKLPAEELARCAATPFEAVAMSPAYCAACGHLASANYCRRATGWPATWAITPHPRALVALADVLYRRDHAKIPRHVKPA
jgi:hypothetical protein